jgi:phospholipid/cholesterol/gamma-HCH transport system permease protein
VDATPRFAVELREAGLTLRLAGDWVLASRPPGTEEILAELARHVAPALALDCRDLGAWDSLLPALLRACRRHCEAAGMGFDTGSAPTGVQRLLALADAVTPHLPPQTAGRSRFLRLLAGEPLQLAWRGLLASAAFTGELALATARLLSGRSRMRLLDVLWFVQQAGPRAIGIVTLISVLVGMILAYLGSVQLKLLGAQIYVAHLVALGMVREMGALMTGVIMAGRTGAAYAAELGTMQTRDEIDAIETLGVSPVEFLVLPRVIALVLVMPLLCIYSNVLGMLGGALVAMAMDVNWGQYLAGAQEAVDLTDVATGVAKSIAFGLVIAVCGCRAGIQCGRSSEAVGRATTEAVVRAIVWLVVADAAFNIVYQRLDI